MYENANYFPKRAVETLKKWAPPRQVTFKCPPGRFHSLTDQGQQLGLLFPFLVSADENFPGYKRNR